MRDFASTDVKKSLEDVSKVIGPAEEKFKKVFA